MDLYPDRKSGGEPLNLQPPMPLPEAVTAPWRDELDSGLEEEAERLAAANRVPDKGQHVLSVPGRRTGRGVLV